jgi:hypothetical protein
VCERSENRQTIGIVQPAALIYDVKQRIEILATFRLRALPLCHARLQRSRGGGSSAPRNNFISRQPSASQTQKSCPGFPREVHLVRWAKVQDQDVVVMSLDHLFKATRQFCAAACGEAAAASAEIVGWLGTREGTACFNQPT